MYILLTKWKYLPKEFLLNNIFLPQDVTLQDLLEPETFELLAYVCMQYGFSIDDVARLKPSMIINILSLLQVEKYGFVQLGVDFYYFEKAQNANKPIYFLETVESQILMLVSMGEGYENEFVLYSLNDMENTESGLEILLYEWKHGNSFFMDDLLISMKDEWPHIYQIMITDRHDIWIPQIMEFIASEKVYFVIAGVLHMHGPDGLLQMLKDRGFTVEQL